MGPAKLCITLSSQSIDPEVQSAKSNQRITNQELYSNLYNKYSHKRDAGKKTLTAIQSQRNVKATGGACPLVS